MKFRGKQTNQQNVLKNRQTKCFFVTKTFFDNIRPIGKIYDRLFDMGSRGGHRGVGGRSSDPSKRHDVSV